MTRDLESERRHRAKLCREAAAEGRIAIIGLVCLLFALIGISWSIVAWLEGRL